jgi:hypothetical protein
MLNSRGVRSRVLGSLAILALACTPLAAWAQTDLRNSFPGRRLGGGTRGECSARLVAHLVPANSVYAPGASGMIGILEGPTANPRPLQVLVKTEVQPSGTSFQRDLPANGPGVTLLTIGAVQGAKLWESAYRCDQSQVSGGGLGLDFVESASPPAMSMLVSDVQSSDQRVAASLQILKTSCGKAVPTATVAKAFGLEDAITAEWPQQLPVRCL